MKNFFNHNNIRKQLECINLATGFLLILISLVYIKQGDVDYFASWFVFGCMYMVMDTYWCSGPCSRSRERIDLVKYTIGWAGLLVSFGFLLYIVVN